MTFCGTFRKNVARIERATHHEDYIMPASGLKRYILRRISPKCQIFSLVISRGVVRRFSLKEVFLRILQNSQEIPSTGVSS